jgi:hypothetical protein
MMARRGEPVRDGLGWSDPEGRVDGVVTPIGANRRFRPQPGHQREMSKREFAAFKGVSVRTVERWMTAGLPVRKYGRARNSTVRVLVDDAELWLSGLSLGQDSV